MTMGYNRDPRILRVTVRPVSGGSPAVSTGVDRLWRPRVVQEMLSAGRNLPSLALAGW